MFRKDAVRRAGNYGNIVGSEDCELWIRLCPFGEISNLPDVLLSVCPALTLDEWRR